MRCILSVLSAGWEEWHLHLFHYPLVFSFVEPGQAWINSAQRNLSTAAEWESTWVGRYWVQQLNQA